jgi:hypothetical protein
MLETRSFRIHNAKDGNTYMTIEALPGQTLRFVSLNERMPRLETPKLRLIRGT